MRKEVAFGRSEPRIPFRVFQEAINANCTCGGSGPGEADCVACAIWHTVGALQVLSRRRGRIADRIYARERLERIASRRNSKPPKTAADELEELMRPLGPKP